MHSTALMSIVVRFTGYSSRMIGDFKISIPFSFMSRNFKIRMAGSFGLTLCFLKVYSIAFNAALVPSSVHNLRSPKNPSPGPATHKKLLVRHKPGRTGVHAP